VADVLAPFSMRLPENSGRHLCFGIDALASAFFFSSIFIFDHDGCVHVAIFRPQRVEHGGFNTILTAMLRHDKAVFCLLQDASYLDVKVTVAT